jgi:hypothetical protein
VKVLKGTILALLLALLCACGTQTQVVAADTVAVMANATIDPLLSAYEAEGNEAIQRAETVEELMLAIPSVRDRWEPVWAALRVFAEAHDAWATALEHGQEGDLAAVQAAWCALRSLAVEFGVRIGDFLVLRCQS